MNDLVMAELQTKVAQAVQAHEKIQAQIRSTPTVGRHATQLSLQRRAKELREQKETWERIFHLALSEMGRVAAAKNAKANLSAMLKEERGAAE